jgi:hypothetical protein
MIRKYKRLKKETFLKLLSILHCNVKYYGGFINKIDPEKLDENGYYNVKIETLPHPRYIKIITL